MQNKPSERRRIHIVKMEFQRNFILKFCALIILSSLIIGAALYFLTASSATSVFENSRLVIKSTSDFLVPLLVISCLMGIIVSGVLTIIITLFVSHRIAGPIYRLEKDIDEVDKGNLSLDIRVRSNDELKDLAKSLNRMVSNLRMAITELNKGLSAISTEPFSNKEKQQLENVKNILRRFKC